MNNTERAQEKVTSIICKTLTIEKVDVEKDLIESGLLDSLAFVQLIVALEEGFDIKIEPEELDMEDYRSVSSITKMILRLSHISILSNCG